MEIADKIINDYITTNDSLNKICKKYNVDFKKGKNILLQNDIVFEKRTNKRILDKQEIIDMFEIEKLGVVEIANKLHTNHKKISDILKENSIIPNKRCKYIIDTSFFEHIDNEYKAYLLGFITADGYVQNENNNLHFGITIHEKDIEILHYFKKHTKSNAKIHFLKNNLVRLNVNNHIFVENLFNLGVIPNKTFNTKPIFNNVPHEFKRDFIRGYFDGDGTVFNSSNNVNLLRVGFIGNSDFITLIQKELGYGKIYKRNYTEVVDLSIKKQHEIEKVFHYLYDNSNIYLQRKYTKFNKFVK